MFTSTLGTGADRLNGQPVVHLLMVHLSGSNRENHKVNKTQKYKRLKNIAAFCLMTTPVVQTVQGYKKWHLRQVEVPGQEDSVQWEVHYSDYKFV